MPRLTSSLCSRASLLLWAQLVLVCALVHSARLARLLVTHCRDEHAATDRLAPHVVAYAANVTSAVWSPGCLKPEELF